LARESNPTRKFITAEVNALDCSGLIDEQSIGFLQKNAVFAAFSVTAALTPDRKFNHLRVSQKIESAKTQVCIKFLTSHNENRAHGLNPIIS
jgi:hypothetical protein